MKKLFNKTIIFLTIFAFIFPIAFNANISFAAEWSFTKTNKLLVALRPSEATTLATFTSEAECNTARNKVSTTDYTLGECKESGNIVPPKEGEGYTFNIVMKGQEGSVFANDNRYGFTTMQDCNIQRDAFLDSETYKKNIETYSSVSFCEKKSNLVSVSPSNINEVENKSIYKFLAPIGKITCMDTTGQDPNCISNNIGTYLNFIFKLGIGVCAALAVIMLIISGISYMGDESVFGKTEAKSKMFSAILGLLIAIGAWALLNTINPDLTGSKGLSIAQANIEIENESTPWVKYEKSDGKPVTGCLEGFTDVTSGNGNPIHVCKSIATDLAKLITTAKEDGIILSGGGFRSKAEQVALRAKNCQPPTKTQQELESGNIVCRVATAIPGNSNHEKGLAVDFTCNGSSMGKTDTSNICYKWLVANASKYGLYNKYATIQETWHWSVSGT